jgi:hypothetical protein
MWSGMGYFLTSWHGMAYRKRQYETFPAQLREQKYDSFMNTRNTRPKCIERTRVILQLVQHPIGLLYLELIPVLTI